MTTLGVGILGLLVRVMISFILESNHGERAETEYGVFMKI